jgi:hypothetical protein
MLVQQCGTAWRPSWRAVSRISLSETGPSISERRCRAGSWAGSGERRSSALSARATRDSLDASAGHPTERDRFKRVAENVDLLKKLVAKQCPTFASWQFSRDAVKKFKKKEKLGLEDIGYSDAIGQHSALVLGLRDPDTVQEAKQRIIDIMKGRSGEQGSFEIKWNFLTMSFAEIVGEAQEAIAA